MQYTNNPTATTATFGEKSPAVLELQKKLNTLGAGLKEDSMYGPLTQAAFSQFSDQLNTPAPTTTITTPSAPLTVSDDPAAKMEKELQNYVEKQTESIGDSNKRFDNYLSELEKRRDQEVAAIEAQFKEARERTEGAQKGETGSTQAGLLRMGGFLGESGSGTGVMLNLAQQHRNEINALEGKKAAAIQAARNAFSDKQFELAKQKASEAKSIEKDIISRQDEFFNRSLQLSQEQRAGDKFSREKAEQDLDAVALLSDNEFLNLDPKKVQEIESVYGIPGYVKKYREIAKAQATAKTNKEKLELNTKIFNIIKNIPKGQKVTMPDGTVYIGIKEAKKTGDPFKGKIYPSLADQLGLPPSVVGMSERDLILSLELANPPAWFKESLGMSMEADALKAEWEGFREDQDMQAYRNTVRLNQRTGLPGADSISALMNQSGEGDFQSDFQSIYDEEGLQDEE